MRSALMLATVLGFCSVLLPQTSPASPQQPSPRQASGGAASFSISGIVVSAATGTPLDRAEVTLFVSGPNGAQVAQAVTGENGYFGFEHLDAGRYQIQGFRRGYISGGYEEHDGYVTGIVTGTGLDSGGLRLALLPTSVIGGTVVDDSGEPVAGAQVRLFRQDQRNGEETIINTQTQMTDDTGAYEFSRVRAGTFYIAVTASPWYAFHSSPKTDSNGNVLPPDQQPHSALDVAYSTTFYPNGTDSDTATPIAVKAGDHVEADFSLHAVPAIHIQIRLPASGNGQGVPMPQLMQQVFGAEENTSASQFVTGTKDGGVVGDYSGIAPGHYTLNQYGQPGDANRSASVDLTMNQTVDFSSASAGGADVSGKIAMASGDKLPSRIRLSLVPVDGSPSREGGSVSDDGSFDLRSVSPGRYDVQVGSPGASVSILQMMATGAEVQGNRITVAGQAVLLAATLARGATTVSGYAQQNGKPLGGAMIVLVPRDPALRDLYRRDQSNTDGSFTLSRVVPGGYRLVAIEDGWTLEWGRPEVMAPYLARGIRVEVTGQRELAMPEAVQVQTR